MQAKTNIPFEGSKFSSNYTFKMSKFHSKWGATLSKWPWKTSRFNKDVENRPINQIDRSFIISRTFKISVYRFINLGCERKPRNRLYSIF